MKWSNVGRILAGVFLLFVAYVVGAYLCSSLFPESARANKMEMLADKVGASIGIAVAALLLRRFFLRSFGLALICLAATEVVVYIIILQFTGLLEFTLFDLRFNVGWLYTLTWNVVAAFLIGVAIGHLWDRRAAKKSPQPTDAAPDS